MRVQIQEKNNGRCFPLHCVKFTLLLRGEYSLQISLFGNRSGLPMSLLWVFWLSSGCQHRPWAIGIVLGPRRLSLGWRHRPWAVQVVLECSGRPCGFGIVPETFASLLGCWSLPWVVFGPCGSSLGCWYRYRATLVVVGVFRSSLWCWHCP